jgi:hypothetical protein
VDQFGLDQTLQKGHVVAQCRVTGRDGQKDLPQSVHAPRRAAEDLVPPESPLEIGHFHAFGHPVQGFFRE